MLVATDKQAAYHLVSLGNQILDRDVNVWEGREELVGVFGGLIEQIVGDERTEFFEFVLVPNLLNEFVPLRVPWLLTRTSCNTVQIGHSSGC